MKLTVFALRRPAILLTLVAVLCTGRPARADEAARPEPSPPVEITTSALPSGYRGDEYSTMIRIRQNQDGVFFMAAGLPDGLSMNRSGVISGRLGGHPGDYPVRLIAVDPDDPDRFDETVLTLTVHEPLSVPDTPLSPAVAGAPYRHEIQIRGGSSARRVRITGLPPGLDAGPDGLITGTPEAGPFRLPLQVTVEDPDFPGHRTSRTLRLTVYGPLTVTSGSPPPIRVGEALAFRIEARGGSGRYEFSVRDLPPGLTLDPVSGLLSGVARAPRGVYPGRVEIRDQQVDAKADEALTLTLVDFYPDDQERLETRIGGNRVVPGPAIREHTFHQPGDRDEMILDLTDLPPLAVVRIRTLPRTRPTRPVVTLMDPSGLILPFGQTDPAGYPDGMFVCETPGLFLAALTEASGNTGDYGLSISVPGQRVRLTAAALPDLQTPGPVDLTVATKGGSGSFVFDAEGLPPGLDITEDGRIEGNLTAPAGVYPVTVRVRDRLWADLGDTKPYTLTLVDFFPDAYETGDAPDPRNAKTVIVPDGKIREHTFHEPGDRDCARLETAMVPSGHVLRFQTLPRSRPTPIRLTIVDKDGQTVLRDRNPIPPGLHDHFLESKGPAPLYLTVEHPDGQTGDFGLTVEDMGPRIRIVTERLPDALTRGPYTARIATAFGSGSFVFEGETLPQGLTLDHDGRLWGTLALPPGLHPLTVRVRDLVHEGITDTRHFDLSAVRFFPDAFEALNDNGPDSANTISPGSPAQRHCFHDDADVDWVRLDLETVGPGDRIIIKTAGGSDPAQTSLRLMTGRNVVSTGSGDSSGSTLVFDCALPAAYHLEIRERHQRIGDYDLSVFNSGRPLSLATLSLSHAESDRPYRQALDVRGGCGRYRFFIAGGTLPPGLTLDETTGLISGRNTHWGRFTVTLGVEDRLFAENRTTGTFTLDAFMGQKLTGKTRFVFPHYQTGTFSLTAETTTTRAFPGTLRGGTPGNLRYRIVDHTVPTDRFTFFFDEKTGDLTLTEPGPVACSRYTPRDLDVTVEVWDSIHTNNRMVFHYEIPARCLSY
ncbi:hypothetical protein JCM14469_34480 [Desulfatiferula olefinivorans]